MNTDRRRINGPSGGTSAPLFVQAVKDVGYLQSLRPERTRGPNELRTICKLLQTSIVPSASGSAYLEIPMSRSTTTPTTLIKPSSALKLVCSIQGPKPLPRSVPYSPSLVLTTTVKFAPFASRTRRGYIRDAVERDLGVHLETALRGVIIGERWPKSGVEVVVTVLEGDEDGWWGDDELGAKGGGWGVLNVLAGCITVSSAAIADAGIDCVDIVSGGVAAIIRNPGSKKGNEVVRVLDPCFADHKDIVAACAVGYLAGRDEITEAWTKGNVGARGNELMEGATHAAVGSLSVLKEALLEAVEAKYQGQATVGKLSAKKTETTEDVDMSG
ncbi:exoribonuclease family protein [Amniculicola lignicola CBS 123094]|uniref:Exoribonuclease family protein n=1 Tax=Amniculicola lignicola CBS 123094 TaxID=1392246 RepID=A0A6A5VVV9_9PLEO|nr:exoribonuclease family protein [Amniculicola lignicola CBS 123094]